MMTFNEFTDLPYIDQVIVSADGVTCQFLEERKWIDGRFERNLGLDLPNSGRGLEHAHVLGRRGDELLIVNIDGSGSHGTKGRLHDKDAAALRTRGYKILLSNIIEWTVIQGAPKILFG